MSKSDSCKLAKEMLENQKKENEKAKEKAKKALSGSSYNA
ncbi:hypothetical protein SAMN05518684_11120 [Salipaludibacillus aurantiacus]|uniref:Uncharacterized protein n=1 Tax=Salipaludibacillus aurantiacus TaxID=1601833 RepID=A0A1H9VIR7_9BACI|nr:hypothetical protein SAMN05518684_11120 [Salipaludibacillus aurantiacus]